MPKFGLKCFLGSFIVSLVAVFATTKGYFVLSKENANLIDNEYSIANDTISPQTIELYSQSEEDPILQKYAALSNKNTLNETTMPEDKSSEPTGENVSIIKEQPDSAQDPLYDNIDDTLSVDVSEKPVDSGTILYQPDDEEDEANDAQEDDNNLQIAESNDSPIVSAENTALDTDNSQEDLQIADASEAYQFMIPLEHDFSDVRNKSTVLYAAGENQVAMASQNVKVDNLGAAETAVMTEPLTNSLEDAWSVAEVSNRHLTKNSIDTFNEDHKSETVALNKEANSEARSEHETQVAYKMVKNILIPIPDEIANDENLTPKLSYSEENKKLDAKLQRKNQGNTLDNVRKNNEMAVAEQTPKRTDEENKTLTESIAAWFSSDNENPENKNKEKETGKDVKNTAEVKSESSEEKSSVFKKLLGKDDAKAQNKNDNLDIIPTELKLSFQPNRAEISGQTLEWLHAFSENALNDEEVKIEIRIDGSNSYELQQKRLNLLYTIFANNGVDYSKINIIFTAREPNSFIIRNVKYLPDGTERIEIPEIADEQPKGDNPWF